MASIFDNYDFPLRVRAIAFPLAPHHHDDDYSEPPSPFTIPHEHSVTQLSHRLRAHTLDHVSTDSPSESETSSSAPSSPAWSLTSSPNLTFTADSTTPSFPSTYDLPATAPTMTDFPATGTYHSRNLRLQRQRALRRQCSSSHLREIRALVDRMVSEGSVGVAAKCSGDSGSVVADDETEMDVESVEESEGNGTAGEIVWRTLKFRRSFEGIAGRGEARNLVKDIRVRKRGRRRNGGISR